MHSQVRVSWSPDSSQIVFQAQNKEQTWLDLNTADIESMKVKTILRETTPAWVCILSRADAHDALRGRAHMRACMAETICKTLEMNEQYVRWMFLGSPRGCRTELFSGSQLDRSVKT